MLISAEEKTTTDKDQKPPFFLVTFTVWIVSPQRSWQLHACLFLALFLVVKWVQPTFETSGISSLIKEDTWKELKDETKPKKGTRGELGAKFD